MSFPGQLEIERGVKAAWNFANSWLPAPKPGGSAPGAKKLPLPAKLQLHSNPAMFPTAEVFTRIAGLSGAVAVILGAYGAHIFRQRGTPEARETFETGQRYHLIHSVNCCT